MFNIVEVKTKPDLAMNTMQLDPYKRVVVNQPAFPYVDGTYATAPAANNQYASCSKQTETIPPAPKFTKKAGMPAKRSGKADFSCAVCQEIFRSASELRLHDIMLHAKKRVHTTMKRDWMTKNIKKKGAMDKEYYNTFVACKGCKRQFPARIEQKTSYPHYRLDYYVHCVEECPAYQALGLIKICKNCNRVFLSSQGLGIHHRSCK
jgi:hypothetical protein